MGLRKTRRKPILLLALLPILLASLACRISLATTLAHPTSTPTTSPTNTLRPPSPTSTFTLTPLPPTATLSPTPTRTATATPRPTASPRQLLVLKELWNTVNQNYLYEDFNGLDWEAVYQEYRARVTAGISDEEFYQAMDEMIARLGDDHSIFFSPEKAADEDADFKGSHEFVGIGIVTNDVPERKRVTIVLVFPDSPAEKAGLRAHDSILAVDDLPILDENGDRRDLLRGAVGSQVTLTVQSPGQEPRQVKIIRQQIDSGLPVPYQALTSPSGKRIGYLMLTTFNDETVPRKVRKALQALRSGGRVDGLILDNRQNEGGANTVFEDVLAYFEDGKLGDFVNRSGGEALYVEGLDILNSQNIPLVVLVGPGTASFGEIFSGILQDTRRAFLVGQTSDGNVEILYIYEFSDGSRAWIAHDRFRPLNHPDQDWEKTGIVPDLTIQSNWDEVTMETDPVIQAALKHLDQR